MTLLRVSFLRNTFLLLGGVAVSINFLFVPSPALAAEVCTEISTLTIPSKNQNNPTADPPEVKSDILTSGIKYIFKVSGTYVWAPNPPNPALELLADAEYFGTFEQNPWEKGDPAEDWLDLRVNGQDIDWGPYTQFHSYNIEWTGQGQQVTFQIHDQPGASTDNDGNLIVVIEECVDSTPQCKLENEDCFLPGDCCSGLVCNSSDICEKSAGGCDLTLTAGEIPPQFGVSSPEPADPEGHKIYYDIDWGDGKRTRAPGFGFVDPPGTEQVVSHQWTNAGVYNINAFAIDELGAISDASDSDIDTVCVLDPGTCSTAGQTCTTPQPENCAGRINALCICEDVPNDQCPPPVPEVRGDLDCDNVITVKDYAILFHFWNKDTSTVQSACGTSLDMVGVARGVDSIVNADDFAFLNSCFGQNAGNATQECRYDDVQ